MHNPVIANSNSSEFEKEKSIRQRVNEILGMLLMFLACVLVCHSPGLIHTALAHFSP